MEQDDISNIISDLRDNGYGLLARDLETQLLSGRTEKVYEEKQQRGQASVFRPVGESTMGLSGKKIDVRVVPYNEEERRAIIRAALQHQFVKPGVYLSAVLRTFRSHGVQDVSIGDSRDRMTSLVDHISDIESPAIAELRKALDEDLASRE